MSKLKLTWAEVNAGKLIEEGGVKKETVNHKGSWLKDLEIGFWLRIFFWFVVLVVLQSLCAFFAMMAFSI